MKSNQTTEHHLFSLVLVMDCVVEVAGRCERGDVSLTLTGAVWSRQLVRGRGQARATCACDKRGRATGRSTRCEARGVITADKRRVTAYVACR